MHNCRNICVCFLALLLLLLLMLMVLPPLLLLMLLHCNCCYCCCCYCCCCCWSCFTIFAGGRDSNPRFCDRCANSELHSPLNENFMLINCSYCTHFLGHNFLPAICSLYCRLIRKQTLFFKRQSNESSKFENMTSCGIKPLEVIKICQNVIPRSLIPRQFIFLNLQFE